MARDIGYGRNRAELYRTHQQKSVASLKKESAPQHPVNEAAPTHQTIARDSRDENAKRSPSQRRRPLSLTAEDRRRRRLNIVPKHVEPTEVFTPRKDSKELREQVHGLLEHVIGNVALSEDVQKAFQDETRRSVLIQRARDALEKSGFAQEALIAPAQRINELVEQYGSEDTGQLSSEQ